MPILKVESGDVRGSEIGVRDNEGARTCVKDRLLFARLPSYPVVLHEDDLTVLRGVTDPDLILDKLFCFRVPLSERLHD